jgi:hypothetical protein
MEYAKEICKVTDNQIVYPIKDYENIGDSLSSINYNFNVLDIYTCNFEFSAANFWNSMYSVFNSSSASWINAINSVRSNSSCWTETYTTVKSLSNIWLKPISLIFPYPFDEEGSEEDIIIQVTSWVNEAFPVVAGSCYNFIVGQELFIFTPQYKSINQILSQSKSSGVRSVRVKFTCNCIGAGTSTGTKTATVDCGTQRLDVAVPDKFVNIFSGLKFIIDPTSSRWVYDSALYN